MAGIFNGGGCVPYQLWPLNPATCFGGRGRRSKVRQRQLMRQTMAVDWAGSRARRKARKVCCGRGCKEEVLPHPYRKWGQLSCGCCCRMALCNVWMLCVYCGMGGGDFRGSIDTSVRIGVLEAQDAKLWAWSGSSLPVQLPVNVASATPPRFGHWNGVAWRSLDVVSWMCHAHSFTRPSFCLAWNGFHWPCKFPIAEKERTSIAAWGATTYLATRGSSSVNARFILAARERHQEAASSNWDRVSGMELLLLWLMSVKSLCSHQDAWTMGKYLIDIGKLRHVTRKEKWGRQEEATSSWKRRSKSRIEAAGEENVQTKVPF